MKKYLSWKLFITKRNNTFWLRTAVNKYSLIFLFFILFFKIFSSLNISIHVLLSSRSHTLSADSFVICLHCLDSFSPFHYNRAISNTLNYLRCLRWQSSSATLVLISTDDRRIPHQNPCWRHSPSHTKSSASVIRMPPCVLPSCTDTDREFAFWEANVEGSEGDSQQRNSEQKQVSDQQRQTRWSFFFLFLSHGQWTQLCRLIMKASECFYDGPSQQEDAVYRRRYGRSASLKLLPSLAISTWEPSACSPPRSLILSFS